MKRCLPGLMMTGMLLACMAVAVAAEDPYGLPPREVRIEQLNQRPREFYAHYMACFPVGRGAIQHHRRSAKNVGGESRQYNLTPYAMNLNPRESADLELRRAMRIGVDGFAIDAWAGGEGAKSTLDALFFVAEEKGYPITITIAIDTTLQHDFGGPWGGGIDAVGYLLDVHGDSPNLARRDGKPLIFTYQAGSLGVQHLWNTIGNEMGWPGQDIVGKRVQEARNEEWGVRRMGEALRMIGRELGTPLYAYYCMAQTPGQHVGIIAQETHAIGHFTGNASLEHGRLAVAQGAEYHPPMYLQYENQMMGRSTGWRGTENIRQRWEIAREIPSTLIQYITWNDYNENTILAPGLQLRYAYYDWTGEMIRWWKTGVPPGTDRDKVYIFSRDYPHTAKVYPRQIFRNVSPGALEIATLLKAPATVRLLGRGKGGADAEWEAPAGMFHEQFPVTPGPVIVELWRDGEKVLELKHPETITERPFISNGGINAYSTECLRHWHEDFGPDEDPTDVMLRGYYADDDGDGMPNWFEMYWFGDLADWSTATIADPNRDPSRDGITNLEAYRRQISPTQAMAPSRPGEGRNALDILEGRPTQAIPADAELDAILRGEVDF